ncbi:MBL fold metallo-hydrolase [Deinococcus sonorensis]|uniref:MBL fold metallo-hydrolase n=2 Tax=Deinococcus sonorensis TaxID=309891 RepID=A0AAU7UGK6_9DEIO
MTLPSPTRHDGPDGSRIYAFPVRVFGDFTANIHLLIHGDYRALIDTGSGSEQSNQDLLAGMAAVQTQYGEPVDWAGLSRIVVTHGHIDHHGGLDLLRSLTPAPVAVHELDAPVLTRHRERLALSRRALRIFLATAGLNAEQQAAMTRLYGSARSTFQGGPVETILLHGDLLDDRLEVLHTPGHSPGQVCLRLGDVLLSADQLLARTTPHLAPESILPGTGLNHYLHSLTLLERQPGLRLALGGHEEPMPDVYDRIQQIRDSHQRKLERIVELCREPRSIAEVRDLLYPQVRHYDVLLSLQKVGALMEYLNQRGDLQVANLEPLEQDPAVFPLYVS